jgi:hypothetical protein
MPQTPDYPDPRRDDGPRPVPPWPEWMDDPAYLALRDGDEDLGDPELDVDPEDAPPPDADEAELAAEAAEIVAAQDRLAAVAGRLGLTAALAADAAGLGRRGPGMPGSAESFPGVYVSRASGFASGKPLDTAPGCLVLGQFAEEAAGPDDRYPGASDDELAGRLLGAEFVTFDPIEELRFIHWSAEVGVEALRISVIFIGHPFYTATITFNRDIV